MDYLALAADWDDTESIVSVVAKAATRQERARCLREALRRRRVAWEVKESAPPHSPAAWLACARYNLADTLARLIRGKA